MVVGVMAVDKVASAMVEMARGKWGAVVKAMATGATVTVAVAEEAAAAVVMEGMQVAATGVDGLRPYWVVATRIAASVCNVRPHLLATRLSPLD